MKQPRVASFFAGIGGFDLGFEQAEFKPIFQCEINKFCGSVLRHHWPDISFVEDISTIEKNTLSHAEVWCGGFPCQDLSVARGSLGRNGLNGSRSSLFFKLAALAQKKKPRVILIENVYGLLNSNDGMDFAELLHTLGSLNYAVSWRLLNSRYFGVPQSRPRVYICAWLNDPFAAGNALFEDRSPVVIDPERSAFLETSWSSGPGPIVPRAAFCLAATSGRHTGTDWSRTYVAYDDTVRRLTPLECERLQGFPDNWTAVGNAAHDTERSDSLRYHALGNAVSVPVVKWIATRIRSLLRNQDRLYLIKMARRDFVVDSVQRWPGLSGTARNTGELSPILRRKAKVVWPNAGILWDGIFVGNRTPPLPYKPAHSDLLDIVEKNRPDLRYFLSRNAAEGILRRVDAEERQLFPLLRCALEKLAGRKPDTYQMVHSFSQLKLRLADTPCALP